MPYGYGGGRSSRSYGPPGSSSRRSAPTHQPSRPSRPTFQPPQRAPTPSRPTFQPPQRAPTYTPLVTTGGGGGRPPPPVTTGGGGGGIPTILPNWATRYNINRPKRTSLWNRWMQQKEMVNLIKENEEKDYHQLGAHDFMQRFDIPKWAGKGLATGYQYGTELARQIVPINKKNIYTALGEDLRKDKPFEPLGAIIRSISDALGRAKEESRLGHLGIEGLTAPQQKVYDVYAKTYNPGLREVYKAKGGIVSML